MWYDVVAKALMIVVFRVIVMRVVKHCRWQVMVQGDDGGGSVQIVR